MITLEFYHTVSFAVIFFYFYVGYDNAFLNLCCKDISSFWPKHHFAQNYLWLLSFVLLFLNSKQNKRCLTQQGCNKKQRPPSGVNNTKMVAMTRLSTKQRKLLLKLPAFNMMSFSISYEIVDGTVLAYIFYYTWLWGSKPSLLN